MENRMSDRFRSILEAEVWNLISWAKKSGTIHEKDLKLLLNGIATREETWQALSRKLEELGISLIPESEDGSIFYPRPDELRQAYSWDEPTLLYLDELEKNGIARCLSLEEECRLASSSDPESADALLEGNLLRVISIARQYVGMGMIPLDLFSDGNQGLKDSALEYRQEAGCLFPLSAVHRIRGAMTAALNCCIRELRIPETILASGTEEQEPEIVQIPLPEEQVSGDVLQDALQDILQQVQEEMTPREMDVIRFRLGLADGFSHTLAETGLKFGITRERIRHIENKFLRKAGLRKKKKQIRDFYT